MSPFGPGQRDRKAHIVRFFYAQNMLKRGHVRLIGDSDMRNPILRVDSQSARWGQFRQILHLPVQNAPFRAFFEYTLPLITDHPNIQIQHAAVMDLLEDGDKVTVVTSNGIYTASMVFDSRFPKEALKNYTGIVLN